MHKMKIEKRKRIAQVLIILFIQLICLFAAAGTTVWYWAWLFFCVSVLLMLINLLILPSSLLEERGREKTGVKKWDKILNSLNVFPTLLMYVFCGLDYRFGWSPELDQAIHLAGFALYLSGSLLFSWSMFSNPFFSTLVHIQDDRGHIVASSGPYKMVRHPGYLGYIIMSLMTPVVLGTLWGLIFSGVTSILFVIRTVLEDSTLQRELPGYRDYVVKVAYRLLPGIW